MTTLDEINQSIERWNSEIAAARSAIRHGQIADAKAHLAGNVSNEAETARNALRRLLDLRDGASLLAVQVELEEVEADIAKCEPRVAALSKKASELRAFSEATARAHSPRIDENDRKRAAAFTNYEKANTDYLREAGEMRDLEARRDQLSMKLAQALSI